MWETFGTRGLFQASYGAADFGECRQAVDQVGSGDVNDWYREWSALADRLVEVGDRSAAGGKPVNARDAYIRATTYYRVAYLPLYGEPTDPRLVSAFEGETDAFAKYAPLHDTPVELVEIPFEDGTTFPGVLALTGDDGRPRATIVHTNGYDSTVAEMFVSHALAANARGYNVLLFDGPGQGRNLIRDGIRIRHDWENVVRPVIDYAVERPEIDPARIILAGWSFGGWLAPRAAAFEDRIAALWADPAQWDERDAVLARLPLSDEEKAAFPDIDPAKIEPMEQALRSPDADPMQRWSLIQRGLWVHGTPTLYDYMVDFSRFELSSVAGNIRCPTLLTQAEDDLVSSGAPKLYEAISADRKELLQFTAAGGASGHCEANGRRQFHQRSYEWLTDVVPPDA
jgi:pimeloyl-ACP methyl ester carboxylesterase